MNRNAASPLTTLIPDLPPLSADDLALMLEIDLAFGRRPDFVNRLRRALEAVAAVQELANRM